MAVSGGLSVLGVADPGQCRPRRNEVAYQTVLDWLRAYASKGLAVWPVCRPQLEAAVVSPSE